MGLCLSLKDQCWAVCISEAIGMQKLLWCHLNNKVKNNLPPPFFFQYCQEWANQKKFNLPNSYECISTLIKPWGYIHTLQNQGGEKYHSNHSLNRQVPLHCGVRKFCALQDSYIMILLQDFIVLLYCKNWLLSIPHGSTVALQDGAQGPSMSCGPKLLRSQRSHIN